MALRSKQSLRYINSQNNLPIAFVGQIFFSMCLTFAHSDILRSLFPLSGAIQEAEREHILCASCSRAAPDILTNSHFKPKILSLGRSLFQGYPHGFAHPVGTSLIRAFVIEFRIRLLSFPNKAIGFHFRSNFFIAIRRKSGCRQHRQHHGQGQES